MIEIVQLTKRYGDTTALADVSLTVPEGTVYGLLGPNGAGKTTALKILAGLLHADGGHARIAGHDVARERRAASRCTGYVADRPTLYDKLTGREYLAFIGDLYGVAPDRLKAIAGQLLERFGLAEQAGRRIESYSQGMRQKLSLIAALAREPQALLIDEPIVGLDPSGVRRMRAVLTEAGRRGTAVLVSTHSLEVARAMCNRLGILHRGRRIAEGSADDLMQMARSGAAGVDPASLEEAFLHLTAEEDALAQEH